MSRKKLVTAAVLALALVLLAAAAMADTYYVKTNDGGSLNVRYTDQTGGTLITKLKYGTAIDVITFTNGGNWALFTYDGVTLSGEEYFGDAYVMAKFLVPYKPEPYSPSSSGSGQSQNTDGSASGTLNSLSPECMD